MAKQVVRHLAIKENTKRKTVKNIQKKVHNLDTVLVVDTETTTDFAQKLKIAGFSLYSLQKQKHLVKGLVIDYENTTEIEHANIRQYAQENKLELIERYTFVNEWLYPILFKGIPYANHNIKFDIGSFCTCWYYSDKDTITMLLCNCTHNKGLCLEKVNCVQHPAISAKHLPSGKFLFNIETDIEIGAIIDTMQLGRALLGASCPSSLLEMGNTFKCKITKFISEEHGQTIDATYLSYTMNDVYATVELYEKQVELYKKYDLAIPMYSLISEASVGKGMYQKIGYTPILKTHDIPVWYERAAFNAYKGARSEVMHRLQPIEIAYLDFMSQYPFCVAWLWLLDLQSAKTLVPRHCKQQVILLLKNFKLEDLRKKDYGKKLRAFVKVKPNGDILPVTSRLEGDNYEVTRNTYVYGPETWYTLLDVLASYIRTGKIPEIIDAMELIPYGKQQLNTIQFFNQEEYKIDPNVEDFASSLIDVRKGVKTEGKQYAKDSDEYVNLDMLQYALKLIANSTTYGMYCETREEEGIDVLGKYACYSIGSLIPACGRFLLAVVETLAEKHGIKYVACDTDSMMLARPENMTRDLFNKKVKEIKAFFSPMSVFKSSNDILELEDVNGDRPLYFIGISSKRYVVYHKLEDGTFHIRKATVNGVGSLQFNKDIDTPFPSDVPVPFIFVKNEKGIYEKKRTKYAPLKELKAWQYLMWYRCIQQVEQGITDVKIPQEEWSMQLVRRSVTANSPHVMNINRFIPDLRPFSFFVQVQAKNGALYYNTPFKATSKELEQSTMYNAKTHRINNFPQFKRLYEVLGDYFVHEEQKVIDGSKIGWLEKRVANIDKVIEVNKKGKEINTQQLSLFDNL